MTKEKKVIKERWESFAPLVRKIVTDLKSADYIQMPHHMKGWGLSAHLLNMLAAEIEKSIEGAGK